MDETSIVPDWMSKIGEIVAKFEGADDETQQVVLEDIKERFGPEAAAKAKELFEASAKTTSRIVPAITRRTFTPCAPKLEIPLKGQTPDQTSKIITMPAPAPNPQAQSPKTALAMIPAGLAKSSEPIVLEPDAPFDSARIFAEQRYKVDGAGTLWCHQTQLYRWSGKHYWPIDDDACRAELYQFLDKTVVRTSRGLDRFRPDQARVTKVLDALRAAVNLDSMTLAPTWLDGDPPVENVKELLACQSGLLHLPTRRLFPHNPRFWSHNVLEYDYDPHAQCPRWLRFLGETFPGDPEAQSALQELFGLCLTDETRFQKAFLIVGPKRSGKGTIGRVIRGLIGPDNCIGPTIAGIERSFGMQSWIGKKVAVFSDARIGKAAEVVTERLLSIIGEDPIDIERKYLGSWNGILPTRIIVLTNELPKFRDESGALPSRFIVLEMKQTFYGREDLELTDKLLAELPGIFNWALDGWDRLRQRKRFEQPASGREAASTLALVASDIKAFVEDQCELGFEYEVEIAKFDKACKKWMTDRNLRWNVPVNQLSAKLRLAYPEIGTERPQSDDLKRPRHFVGIRLKPKPVKATATAPAVVPILQPPAEQLPQRVFPSWRRRV